jgi:pantetheine-phosphate adenylyltransferase
MKDTTELFYNELREKVSKEPWRFYHGMDHVNNILSVSDHNTLLRMFAIFHDWVYEINPSYSGKNEYRSAETAVEKVLLANYSSQFAADLYRLIITSEHKYSHYTDIPSKDWDILKYDLNVFLDPYCDVASTELKVFKEYQQFDFSAYKKGRLEVLLQFGDKLDGLSNNISERISFINHFSPKIGVFAGSFNPLHVGHINILEKAEKMFDKVVVAVGKNTEKANNGDIQMVKNDLKYREVVEYDGLLVTFINQLNYPVTLVRGLRNGNDVPYELNLANALRDINGGVPLNIAYIACDREYEYISSSLVRELDKFGLNMYRHE